MQNPTVKKRIIVSIIWLVFFSTISIILYYFIAPESTCFDGKKNQEEKGIDCGGTCAPCQENIQTKEIVINEKTFVFGGNKTYDVVAKITNPNDSVGAGYFEYIFNLKDAGGKNIATRQGSSFILPADSRYIAEIGIEIDSDIEPKNVEFIVNQITWEKLKDFGKPQLGIYNKNLKKSPVGIGNELEGVIRNESIYNLNKVFLVFVLRDDAGQIVGVNKTEKNFIRSKLEMDFRVSWPYQFSSQVQNIEVDPQSNAFDLQNIYF